MRGIFSVMLVILIKSSLVRTGVQGHYCEILDGNDGNDGNVGSDIF